MKKSRGILSLILVAALSVLLGVTTIRGLDSEGMGAAKNINLGLDLEGGVSITYQVKGDSTVQRHRHIRKVTTGSASRSRA